MKSGRTENLTPSDNAEVDQIQFDSLGDRVGLIIEGAHAGAAPLAGQYIHPELGDLHVKQESDAEKNLVEWSFYQIAKAIFTGTGQEDILARMAPIVLVTPQSENNSLKDIYVGSVSHKDMELVWKAVFSQIYPQNKLPEKRPPGFEHKHQKEIADYIEKFNQQDPGFSMLPVLALLGHHATHLGNLGKQVEDGKDKLVFFDYGAAAWYNFNEADFNNPDLKGNVGDFFAKQLFGFSKNYMGYYVTALDKEGVSERMNTVYTTFEDSLPQISAQFAKSMQKLSKILDFDSFLRFTKYIGMPASMTDNVSKEDLPQVVSKYLLVCIINRVNAIPAFLEDFKQQADAKIENVVPHGTPTTSTSSIFGKLQQRLESNNSFLKFLRKGQADNPMQGLVAAAAIPSFGVDTKKLEQGFSEQPDNSENHPIKMGGK